MAGASRAGGAPGDRSGARAGVALWLGLAELARGRDEDALAELDPRESENGEMRDALAALWLAQPIGRGDPAPAPVIDGSAPPWNPRSWSAQAFLLEAIAHDALRRPAAAGRALEQLGGPQVTARDHQVRLTGNDITNDGAYIRRPGAGVRCRGPRSALPVQQAARAGDGRSRVRPNRSIASDSGRTASPAGCFRTARAEGGALGRQHARPRLRGERRDPLRRRDAGRVPRPRGEAAPLIQDTIEQASAAGQEPR